MKRETRNKMIVGAIELISLRGINATSVREVVRYTNTPRGSIKYHFPNGKLQSMTEAVELSGNHISCILKNLMESHSSIEALKIFIEGWRNILRKSNFEAGCTVLTACLEQYLAEDGNPNFEAQKQLLNITNSIFLEWQQILENSLHRDGISLSQAKRLSNLIITSLKGTVIMCRASKTTDPLDCVEIELINILKSAIQ